MFSGFPIGPYKKFQAALGSVDGRNGFSRLRRYYDSVSVVNGGDEPWDANTRIDSGKYFYYPFEGEKDISRRTCFENSAHLFMAARELYPKSNPRFAYIDEGERGTHSLVFFNHNGQLYGGDFGYQFFCPIHFEGRQIIRRDGGKIKFNSITPISDNEVKEVIGRLRGKGGVEHYLSEGGQKMVENLQAFRPHELFMKYEGGKVISEMRFRDFSLRPNTAIRKTHDLGRNEFGVEFLTHSHSDWSQLVGENRIGWSKKVAPIGGGVYIDGYMSLKEMSSLGIADFTKQFAAYHGTIKRIASRRHETLGQSFVYSLKDRRNFKRGNLKEVFVKYVDSLTLPVFRDHIVDYSLFLADPKILEFFCAEGSPQRWENVRVGNRGYGCYGRSFVGTFRQITRAEERVQRGLDRKVAKLILDR
jgi:hypothetical protein